MHVINTESQYMINLCICDCAGWDITEQGEVVGSFDCCFYFSAVIFFPLTSYFHTTSFIMLICEVERNVGEVERSGAPAA